MKKESQPAFTKLAATATLAERLADEIRRKIVTEYQAGQRLPTTREIAQQFECSINSAHHALAILRREGLIEGRSGRGTHVTKTVSDQHVALVVGMSEQLPHLAYYAGRILTGTIAGLQRQGVAYRVYWDFEGLTHSEHAGRDGDDAQSLWNNLSARRVSAVGVVQKLRSGADNLRLAESGVPVVWNTKMSGGYWVANDFEGLLQQGIAALASGGARKIAVMTWDEDRRIAQGSHPWAHVLRELYQAHGLEWRPEWLRGSLEPNEAGAGYEEFREIWGAFPDKPDGLFVTDDVLLPDVALAIREYGLRVPEDLQVVASANRGGVTCPRFPASRIMADPAAYGQAMVQILASLARNEEPASRQIVIPFGNADEPAAHRGEANEPARKAGKQKSAKLPRKLAKISAATA